MLEFRTLKSVPVTQPYSNVTTRNYITLSRMTFWQGTAQIDHLEGNFQRELNYPRRAQSEDARTQADRGTPKLIPRLLQFAWLPLILFDFADHLARSRGRTGIAWSASHPRSGRRSPQSVTGSRRSAARSEAKTKQAQVLAGVKQRRAEKRAAVPGTAAPQSFGQG